MNESDRGRIAERIRGLIAGQDSGDLALTAKRLGVDEVSLRMSVDELAPYPTIDVLAALVVHYGVDPSYLVSGRYDEQTHRRALATPESAVEAVRSVAEHVTSVRTTPPDQPRHLHLA
jgi:hypothetical protein